MDRRSIGKIKVPIDWLDHNPEDVATIFSILRIVPLHIDYKWDTNEFEYLALGERFETTPPNCEASEYKIVVKKDYNNKIKFVKVVKAE